MSKFEVAIAGSMLAVVIGAGLLVQYNVNKRPQTARYLVVVGTSGGLMSTSVVVSNKTAIKLNEQLVEDLRQYVMRAARTTNAAIVNVIKLEP